MCLCATLPDAVYIDYQPSAFVGSMVQLAVGNWVELCRCSSCGQLWRIDEWDKYQVQVAIKVSAVEGWDSFDFKPIQLKLLVNARGGLTNECCAWANCNHHAVKGVAYCAEHLYDTGARK
ncbi:hypothetical protein HDE76_001255 [Rhodanobacter sp. ANJX3]|nr:hypothetical protein [Rhodanobacter sp. ANJX3]